MRLRTLPVSVAGVISGTACAIAHRGFSLLPAIICLLFAVIAQIASNFANEYYDFKNGLDRKGREGYRRGVTEGDISPAAMKRATFALLIIDAMLGCFLIIWGGWWLIPVGVAVAIFALAYSTGPYPLSHHGLGDIAVIIFFGFVPVIFTEYVQTRVFDPGMVTLCTSLAVGLMAANVLIVNNYRDYDDDKAVGKNTTVVIFGRKIMSAIYLANGIVATASLSVATATVSLFSVCIWCIIAIAHFRLWLMLKSLRGAALNKVLKFTSLLLLCASILLISFFTLLP